MHKGAPRFLDYVSHDPLHGAHHQSAGLHLRWLSAEVSPALKCFLVHTSALHLLSFRFNHLLKALITLVVAAQLIWLEQWLGLKLISPELDCKHLVGQQSNMTLNSMWKDQTLIPREPGGAYGHYCWNYKLPALESSQTYLNFFVWPTGWHILSTSKIR